MASVRRVDYAKYFDKHPLRYYSLGPTGLYTLQSQPFATEWIGWFVPNNGFWYVKTPDYNESLSGYFIPYTQHQNSENFSFTFESGNGKYFALSENGQIYIRYLSGASGLSQVDYSFSGRYPLLFNTSVLERGVNNTYCFYQKNDASIYYKLASENFANERLLFSGTRNVLRLHQAAKPEPFKYRYGIFALRDDAKGVAFFSTKYETIGTGFMAGGFEDHPTGDGFYYFRDLEAECQNYSGRTQDLLEYASDDFQNQYIIGNKLEYKTTFRIGRLLDTNSFYTDSFQQDGTGGISFVNNAPSGLDSGRFVNTDNLFSTSSFQDSLVGDIIFLYNSDIYKGYFIYG